MGNQNAKLTVQKDIESYRQSFPNEKTEGIDFFNLINSVATKYILTQDFQDMLNLDNDAYCDKLAIVVSKIFSQYLTDLEIKYLYQKVKDGKIINEIDSDSVFFLKKSDIPRLDIQNKSKKKRMCIGIARFYIKIFEIYAAIVSTINPVYIYKNNVTGAQEEVPFLRKMNIPSYVGMNRKIEKRNICQNRINSLIQKFSYDTDGKPVNVQIQNAFCNINQNAYGTVKNLMEEPGIPELEKLYYDEFDYEKNKFVGMSSKAKQEYANDVSLFYRNFTGAQTIPQNITKFSDIQLRDFQKFSLCSRKDLDQFKIITANITEKLYQQFAQNMAIMNSNMERNRQQLIDVLDDIFIYIVNPSDPNKKEITLRPDLNEKDLSITIEKARKYIVQLYINCEIDYINTLKVFEALVYNKMKVLGQQRQETLVQQQQTLKTGVEQTQIQPTQKQPQSMTLSRRLGTKEQ